MKYYTKIIGLLCVGIMAFGMITGCGMSEETGQKKAFQIVCTTFPVYDWTRQILGDRAESIEVTLLQDKGVDLHSYQPTAADIKKINNADLFIYIGGESDDWVEKVLKTDAKDQPKVLRLMDALAEKVKEEAVVEGMQAEEEGEHDHDEPELDEHIWLSFNNAKIACNAIATALQQMDGDHAQEYIKRDGEYIGKLSEMDEEYGRMAAQAKHKAVIFGDRFPFRYLMDDYGITYSAAFVGCSAETKASFQTISYLAQKVDATGISTILTIENSDQKIAKTIVENTKAKNQKIQALDSMQSVTASDISKGETYLGIMEKNLSVLRGALNE